MNEFFSTIYAWIVFQFSYLKKTLLSLFKREKEDNDIERLDNDLNSDNLDQTTSITPSSNTAITTDVLEEMEHKDASAVLEEIEIYQHEEPFYDGKYDSLFNTPDIPILQSVVNEEIWDVIYEKLPEDYKIPLNTSTILYKNQTHQL